MPMEDRYIFRERCIWRVQRSHRHQHQVQICRKISKYSLFNNTYSIRTGGGREGGREDFFDCEILKKLDSTYDQTLF